MVKLINAPVRVETAADGSPLRFWYRGWHRIAAVIDVWQEMGQWWEGEGKLTVYRVLTEGGRRVRAGFPA